MCHKPKYFPLITALALIFIQPVNAAIFIQTNVLVVAEGETLENDLWLSAHAAIIEGEAKDDLFLLVTAQSWKALNEKDGVISVSGQCGNDLWALANKIELNGVVQDHARLLARMITVNGSVSNSAILAANSIHLTQTSRLGRDAWLIGENIILEGRVDGAANVIGKNVTLAGNFGGEVRLTAADIAVLPHAKINGNLIYSSAKELVLDKNVELNGELIREAEEVVREDRTPLLSWPVLAMQSWLFSGALGVGALLLLLFPSFIGNASLQINQSAWKCLLTGFIALCLIPLACFFLALSIIGLPPALLTFMVFLILIYLSKIIVALALGALIIRRKAQGLNALPALGLGLVILYLAAGSGLPGMIIWFAIVCLGVGALISAYFAGRPAAAP